MVTQLNNFLTKEECSTLIEMIEQNNLDEESPIVFNIKQKISDTIKMPLDFGEPLQGFIYKEGEFPEPFTDYFWGDSFLKHCQYSGNRVYTALLYLNDIEEGGETNLPHINISITPKAGNLAYWRNMLNGKVNEKVLREEIPPTKGKKYIIASWWREKIHNPNKDEKTFQEYISQGYKSDYSNSKGYYILPQPKIVKDVIKDIDILTENVPPHTIHQLPSLANLMINYVYGEVRKVFKEQIEIFSLGNFKRYYKGDTVPILEYPKVDNIISVILSVNNDITLNQPWPISIKKENQTEKIYLTEGNMLLYTPMTTKVSMFEPLDGFKFVTLDMHYRMKLL